MTNRAAHLGLDLAQLEFRGYLGEHTEEDARVILQAVQSATTAVELKKSISSWIKLPYPVRRVGSSIPNNSDSGDQGPDRKRAKIVANSELVDDIDEW